LFAAASFLGSILLDPGQLTGGNAPDAMEGAIVLGIVLFAGLPSVLEHKLVVLSAVAIESAIALGLYCCYLTIGPWRSEANTVVLAGMHQRMLSDELGRSGVVILALILSAPCLAAILWHPPFRTPKEVGDGTIGYPERVVPGLPGKVRP
jgi:hypothetical protein